MRKIITDIQSLGVRVSDRISGRRGGAGPAEGRAFLLEGTAVNVPIAAAYVAHSPYMLQPEGDRFRLLKAGRQNLLLDVVPEARFYRLKTEDGIPYRKIALLHGKDCLASTVIQQCVHWQASRRCAFCGTQISIQNHQTIARKTPAQLAEVARAARTCDGVTHVVLTSGTGDPPGSEIPYLAECAEAVKAASDLPVHVQFAPPANLVLMDDLKAAGVDTVGIHIESFEPDILKRIAPAKAQIGLARYEQAWKRAVALFGPNQVSSFLIVGLGEDPASVVWGSELLADLGVYPFVVPLRPIPGSRMQDRLPPAPDLMERIYAAVARILQQKGLSAAKNLAGCVRCGACSALSAYEKTPCRFIFHSARTPEELDQVFAVRNEVFVREQHLFDESDVDEHDRISHHLVAKTDDDHIVGTVRVYPADPGSDHWIGSRLAVRKPYRVWRVGAGLVQEAMKRVKKKGCTKFTAHIQAQNVRFFTRLGWRSVGPREHYCGLPHQLMQADLDRVPEDF